MEKVTVQDKPVIRVTFTGTESPYSAFGKYYIRTADEDRELTPAELRKMMIGKEYEENWGDRSSDETADDVDEQTVDKFYRLATECGRLPDIGRDKNIILEKLGLMNGNHLTNSGKYLFSANNPIVLKMAVFATDHKTTFLDINREEGNIFQLIDRSVNYIVRNIRWSAVVSQDGIHRVETPEIPIDAIREAVINCFAHARYDMNIQHEIDIFSNRISIINPGSFANDYLPEDFVSRDLHSFLRNESIAKTLYLCKDVETFGSGLRKIYSLCGEAGVTVSYNNTDTAFALEFSRKDRNIMPSDGSTNGSINVTVNDMMPDLEADVLSLLRDNPYLTTSELSGQSGKSTRSIARALNALKNKQLIERIGSNKTGYWKVK